MTIYPQSDRVVVERDEAEKRTRGGLFLPDGVSKDNRPLRGIVRAVGPGKVTPSPLSPTGTVQIPIGLNLGDHVLFKHYAGESYTIGGKEVFLVDAADIVAIVVGHDEPNDEPEEEEATFTMWPGGNWPTMEIATHE